MKLIPCALIERWLEPVADGEAGGWRRALVLAHLRGCDRCARQARTLAHLTSWLTAYEAPHAPDVRGAVAAAIACEAIVAIPRRWSAWGLGAVGATALVLVTVGWWLQARTTHERATEVALAQPATAATLYAEAVSYEQAGYYDEAAERYRTVYEETADPLAGIALARTQSARGYYNTALSTYTHIALESMPWETEPKAAEGEGATQ